ncbi:asparagine synthetase domain-containing protein CG17486 isoform X2 [Chrysoperla carnea]|uniref:asparagine synthetase domain-containing protein CG17486 isoform X2 n=1 Tax=Chrysoperla carnea TaxID=189513 RepID=UPI001D07DEFF|nr:asparagine synthetase domain-containing protein CG17486 isoform X2 [Chrysoperla carnea]
MCGILCSITNAESNTTCSCIDQSDFFLHNRGPDLHDITQVLLNKWNVSLLGYVLWLQGKNPVNQPVHENDQYMLFNGDIFGELIQDETRLNEGDTLPLFNALIKSQSILSSLKQLNGPYAIVYLDKNKLYFARDHYGRRSLLISNHNNHLVISSVLKRNLNYKCIEIPPIGLFHIDLDQDSLEINVEPWNIPSNLIQKAIQEMEQLNLKINVNYDNYVPLTILHKELDSQLSMLDVLLNNTKEESFEKLLNDIYWQTRVIKLKDLLQEAVHIRVITQPKHCKNTIGILFSGGLDCTILAVLAHKCLPLSTEIHLFNVAFEKNNVNNFDTPDRKTAIESLKELSSIYPERKWKFFEINILQTELQEQCSKHITHLINPLSSILDDSLGCAVWFASRGCSEEEKSPCRLLLVGMGADELFGGYTRHRNAFRRGGWIRLSEELANDWNNLPHRNLARDDRVISDHSRQTRTPYLDESVVKYVSSLPTWDKCYLSDKLPSGVGDKLLLRLLAYHLGLRNVPFFPKRALQFGSRIANSKENAKDISYRLQNFV